jgi:hypothetical protein
MRGCSFRRTLGYWSATHSACRTRAEHGRIAGMMRKPSGAGLKARAALLL